MSGKENGLRLQYTSKTLAEAGFGGLTNFKRHPEKKPDNLLDFERLMNSPRAEVDKLLEDRLGPMVDRLTILDADGQFHLFNDHTRVHIEFVAEHAHYLLDQAGYNKSKDDIYHNIASIIAWTHDLGNLASRHGHSELSVRLLPELFTNFRYDDPRFLSVVLGVYLHDEPKGREVENFADFFPSEYYAPAIYAVIASDKFHIHRNRLSKNIAKQQGFPDEIKSDPKRLAEREIHTAISLYSRSCDFSLQRDGLLPKDERAQTALLLLQFSSQIDDQDDKRYLELLNQFVYSADGKPGDLWVNSEMYRSHKQQNISYSDAYRAMVEQVYSVRFAVMNSCLFALFPDLKVIRFGVEDKNPLIRTIGFEEYYREDWQNTLFHAWKIKNETGFKNRTLKPPAILTKGYKNYLETHTKKPIS